MIETGTGGRFEFTARVDASVCCRCPTTSAAPLHRISNPAGPPTTTAPHSSPPHLSRPSTAPISGFMRGSDAIGSIVKYALARAGANSPHRGSHQFRHALAVRMLRGGASLAEIGEVLRHRSPQTTSIYARVDIDALRPLALPWPGGAQ